MRYWHELLFLWFFTFIMEKRRQAVALHNNPPPGGIYVHYRLLYNDLIKDVFARIGKDVSPFV